MMNYENIALFLKTHARVRTVNCESTWPDLVVRAQAHSQGLILGKHQGVKRLSQMHTGMLRLSRFCQTDQPLVEKI